MKSRIAFAALALAFIAFSSCKKDDTATVAQRLVGKWYDEKFVTDLFSGGIHSYDSSLANSGDYNEFLSDSRLIFGDIDGPYAEINYTVLGNDKIVFDDGTSKDTSLIISFTDNKLVLRTEYDDAGDHYTEDWYMTK